jgi:hypothetical protein
MANNYNNPAVAVPAAVVVPAPTPVGTISFGTASSGSRSSASASGILIGFIVGVVALVTVAACRRHVRWCRCGDEETVVVKHEKANDSKKGGSSNNNNNNGGGVSDEDIFVNLEGGGGMNSNSGSGGGGGEGGTAEMVPVSTTTTTATAVQEAEGGEDDVLVEIAEQHSGHLEATEARKLELTEFLEATAMAELQVSAQGQSALQKGGGGRGGGGGQGGGQGDGGGSQVRSSSSFSSSSLLLLSGSLHVTLHEFGVESMRDLLDESLVNAASLVQDMGLTSDEAAHVVEVLAAEAHRRRQCIVQAKVEKANNSEKSENDEKDEAEAGEQKHGRERGGRGRGQREHGEEECWGETKEESGANSDDLLVQGEPRGYALSSEPRPPSPAAPPETRGHPAVEEDVPLTPPPPPATREAAPDLVEADQPTTKLNNGTDGSQIADQLSLPWHSFQRSPPPSPPPLPSSPPPSPPSPPPDIIADTEASPNLHRKSSGGADELGEAHTHVDTRAEAEEKADQEVNAAWENIMKAYPPTTAREPGNVEEGAGPPSPSKGPSVRLVMEDI